VEAKGMTCRAQKLPPPAFRDPLVEGDKSHVRPQTVPLTEGVAEGRGRLPKYRTLYNARLRPTAGELRKNMTKAEACLWKFVLRAGQLKGYTFNRQRPVLHYIADFICKPLNLIIEVDGSSHDNWKVQKHDAFRQSELEACGFVTIRFTNDQILHAIDLVKKSILAKINEIESAAILTCRKQPR
jgi:very-short-patch-repair endonuclease